MRIVARRILVEFYRQHADAKTALDEWYKRTSRASWECFAEVKRMFNSVDSVGDARYVFNIKGNDYRLVALILFKAKTVYIRFVGTHSEYDKIREINKI